jgi:hypothetical protein
MASRGGLSPEPTALWALDGATVAKQRGGGCSRNIPYSPIPNPSRSPAVMTAYRFHRVQEPIVQGTTSCAPNIFKSIES